MNYSEEMKNKIKSNFEQIEKYIYENPIKWQDDCFYTED